VLTPSARPQLCPLLGEDPLGCDGDGIALPQGRRGGGSPGWGGVPTRPCQLPPAWVLTMLPCTPAEAGAGDGAELAAAAQRQRLPAAERVPQDRAARAGRRRGLPAPDPAGHPVRLRHRQGRQAAGHHHHPREEAVSASPQPPATPQPPALPVSPSTPAAGASATASGIRPVESWGVGPAPHLAPHAEERVLSLRGRCLRPPCTAPPAARA